MIANGAVRDTEIAILALETVKAEGHGLTTFAQFKSTPDLVGHNLVEIAVTTFRIARFVHDSLGNGRCGGLAMIGTSFHIQLLGCWCQMR